MNIYKRKLILATISMYLAYVHLCIHNNRSENPPDIQGDISTLNKYSNRYNNAVLLCRHRFRTEQKDLQTTNTTNIALHILCFLCFMGRVT